MYRMKIELMMIHLQQTAEQIKWINYGKFNLRFNLNLHVIKLCSFKHALFAPTLSPPLIADQSVQFYCHIFCCPCSTISVILKSVVH